VSTKKVNLLILRYVAKCNTTPYPAAERCFGQSHAGLINNGLVERYEHRVKGVFCYNALRITDKGRALIAESDPFQTELIIDK